MRNQLGYFIVNKNKYIQTVETTQLRDDIPSFSPGDTIVVDVRVVEGTRERLQPFEGVVLSIKKRGLGSSFIVRKISIGVGVDRTFQTHSPIISSIKVKPFLLYFFIIIYFINNINLVSASCI